MGLLHIWTVLPQQDHGPLGLKVTPAAWPERGAAAVCQSPCESGAGETPSPASRRPGRSGRVGHPGTFSLRPTESKGSVVQAAMLHCCCVPAERSPLASSRHCPISGAGVQGRGTDRAPFCCSNRQMPFGYWRSHPTLPLRRWPQQRSKQMWISRHFCKPPCSGCPS